MSFERMDELGSSSDWKAPVIRNDLKHGDMPGDKIEISQQHIINANTIFPKLLELVKEVGKNNQTNRIVVSVCGGSGVGKSETASLLSYYFSKMGIGSYTLSGDNYPRRIPMYNDAERLRVFRKSGLQSMIKYDVYTAERFGILQEWQKEGSDANEDYTEKFPWFQYYMEGGKEGLRNYLGTSKEIDFEEISEIITSFKTGVESIWLKRMGRTETELWYEKVDFRDVNILMIEWTHGNSDYLEGVDIPILLNSTPEETLEHRRLRNRDGKTDSPFTMRVLEIEQKLLEQQAAKAKIILSKQGKILTFEEYQELMQIASMQREKEGEDGKKTDGR